MTIADNDDPFVTVRYHRTSYQMSEGETVTVTVRLFPDTDPERQLVIPLTVYTRRPGGQPV